MSESGVRRRLACHRGERDDVLTRSRAPERGAELHSLVHVPTETELLFQAPWGLCDPRARTGTSVPRPLRGRLAGALPSTNDETTYGGETIPFHGEVALLPWECERREQGAGLPRPRCERTPFLLERARSASTADLIVEAA